MAVSPEHQKSCISAILIQLFYDQHKRDAFVRFLFPEISWRYLATLKTVRFKPVYAPKVKKSFFLDATFSTGGTPGVIVFFPQPEVLLPANLSKAAGRLSLRALGASTLRCGMV